MNDRLTRIAPMASITASVTAVALALAGCAARTRPPPVPPSAEPAALEPLATRLLPAETLPGDLLLQQHVTIRWRDREESFDAVLQKSGRQLLLLGLGPMNTVGFSLALEDRRVAFVNQSGREMPFDPEHILADVQRIFYPWIEDDPLCTNCERHAARAGLDIRERIGPRHLEERQFAIDGRPDRGEVVVHYDEWLEGGRAPTRATLDNGWFGYQISIDSVEVEASPDLDD
jgi:hypothetical protein